MEQEVFISGYCRCTDASRMVAVCLENGRITDIDCNMGACPYESDCPVAKNIRENLLF